MKAILSMTASVLALAATPALAQTATQTTPSTPAPSTAAAAPATAASPAAAPAVGATVYDASGAEVGKIESITNGTAVVFTGTNRAGIPLDRFGTSPKGPTLALTKVELDAAADQAKAQAGQALKDKLVAGAEVHGLGGTLLGTVKATTAEAVTVTTTAGKDVQLPIGSFGPAESGVAIGMTAEQFNAAVQGAQ